MRIISFILFLITLLLLNNCGGGGSVTENGTIDSTGSSIEQPESKILKTFKSYTHSIISVQQKMYEGLNLLSDNFNHTIEVENISLQDANAFYEKIESMEHDIVNIVIQEYQLAMLGEMLSAEEWNEGDIKSSRFLISGPTILTGVLIVTCPQN